MARQVSNKRSIKIFFRFVMFFPIAFINIFAIVVALLAFFYARTDDPALFLATVIFAGAMIALYIAYSLYVMRQFRNVFINGLYGTTIPTSKILRKTKTISVNIQVSNILKSMP